jgi:hypothetical protein
MAGIPLEQPSFGVDPSGVCPRNLDPVQVYKSISLFGPRPGVCRADGDTMSESGPGKHDACSTIVNDGVGSGGRARAYGRLRLRHGNHVRLATPASRGACDQPPRICGSGRKPTS